MTVSIDEFYREFYAQGHLDYVLLNLQAHDTIDKWIEFLKHEPIAFFENSEDWTMTEYGITYLAGTAEQESYAPSLAVELDSGEHLLHSAEASQSMFFEVLEDNKLRLIYVD